MVRTPLRHGIAAVLLGAGLLLAAPLRAGTVDLAKSSVTATARQLGVPMEGRFRKFSATVNFLPAQPVQSRASIEIDVGSYDLGSAEFNREVLGKDWFHVAKFPKANFVSTDIKLLSAGKYQVAGKLTVKGHTQDVTLPVMVSEAEGRQIFEGVLPIKRNAFQIGEGEWQDTSVVADEVLIRFRIITTGK